MCKYCVQYGDGMKWYLNPKNYDYDYYYNKNAYGRAELHKATIDKLGGAEKNTFEIGTLAAGLDALVPDLQDEEGLRKVDKIIEDLHGGQVIPLEDAKKIISNVYAAGGRVQELHCACRRYFGLPDEYSCMFFSPVADMTDTERPWENLNPDHRTLTEEEAKKELEKWDKKGYIHQIWHAAAPIPIVICNCDVWCLGVRARIAYGLINAARKGEYVCVVDPVKCDGCGGEPACVKRCTFGGLSWSPLVGRVVTFPSQCWGCGVCRAGCPRGALRLADRTTFPALANNW